MAADEGRPAPARPVVPADIPTATADTPVDVDTTAGSRSSRDVERDVRRTRAVVDQTLEAIATRLGPQQLIAEALGGLGGGASAVTARLLEMGRRQPLAAALIGLGLSMMLAERRPGAKGLARLRGPLRIASEELLRAALDSGALSGVGPLATATARRPAARATAGRAAPRTTRTTRTAASAKSRATRRPSGSAGRTRRTR